MADVVLLDNRHNADLYKLLVKSSGGPLMVQHRELYLNSANGSAIAYVDAGIIKQVLLCEIIDDICFTRGIFGSDIGGLTVEILDILCAVCSSRTPMIENHSISLQSNQVSKFKEAWLLTRLHKMTSNERWCNNILSVTIDYPV